MNTSGRGRWWGPAVPPAVACMALVAGAGWLGRTLLHAWAMSHPAGIPAVLVGLPVLMAAVAGALRLDWWVGQRAWIERTVQRAGLEGLARRPMVVEWIRGWPDPGDWLFRPLLRTGWGKRLTARWQEAGFVTPTSRFLLLMILAAALGWVVGNRIAGPILAAALGVTAAVGPSYWADSRRNARRVHFASQIPFALDTIAAGLAAGLSFEQAVNFAASELSPPIAEVMRRMDIRLRLGRPTEDALEVLTLAHPHEMMALAVEGIQLQRQYGGDLVRMLGDTADLLRSRLELDREARAVSSQGRLSAVVVAGLVPVSAGLLLTMNPRYIDVLFDTLEGQILLVLALALQLAGWAIVSRLVRIRY